MSGLGENFFICRNEPSSLISFHHNLSQSPPASISAPLSSRILTISSWECPTARFRAVAPSSSVAFTSIPLDSKFFTNAASPSSDASMRSVKPEICLSSSANLFTRNQTRQRRDCTLQMSAVILKSASSCSTGNDIRCSVQNSAAYFKNT